jgi:riboflavin-specific deaminase-like protein
VDLNTEGSDAARIWHSLVEVRDHDWASDPRPRFPLAAGHLTFHRSGDWQADVAVEDGARAMLDVLARLACAERMVVGQLGQSLDGRIATRTGHSQYINGPVALAHLHRIRALVDAVLVGAGTACADLPQLTVRNVDGPDPTPVIVDPRGRVPATGPLFETDGRVGRVLHLVAPGADPDPAPDHVERVRVELANGSFAPAAIISALEQRGLRRLLVEGGADTISRFIDAGKLDRLHLLVAPLVIGSGRNGLELKAIDRLDEARRPRIHSFTLGDELLVDVDLASDRD